ncbi:MAG: hypothetical protein ABSC55_18175 [Syntrophorhabdales bacterium]
MANIEEYINAIHGDKATLDDKHADATKRLSKLLPETYLERCLDMYTVIKEYDKDFKNGDVGKIADSLKDMEDKFDYLLTRKVLDRKQKRVLMHKIIMEMDIPSHQRIQCLVGLWSKRVDKRRNIALDFLIESIVQMLDKIGKKRCWTLMADFLMEQGLWDTDDTENEAEALRLHHKRIANKGYAVAVLDVILHVKVATGEATSTSI